MLKRNDSKYIDACIMVVDYFEFICQEIDIQQEIEKHRSHKITKWSSIRKNFSEKKYPQAGYGLLKNLNVILCSEKLN